MKKKEKKIKISRTRIIFPFSMESRLLSYLKIIFMKFFNLNFHTSAFLEGIGF